MEPDAPGTYGQTKTDNDRQRQTTTERHGKTYREERHGKTDRQTPRKR